MVLLSVTTGTWLITGLGFGMVLIILFLFIYIMKGLGWIMQKINTKTPAAAPADTQSLTGSNQHGKAVTDTQTLPADIPAIATALFLNDSEEDMAAVAMALHLYYNNAHDMVFPALTIKHRPTQWNAKSFGINNLYK